MAGGGESNSLILKWSNTILVRKVGSYPVDEQDGTVIINNHNRDFYNGRNYLSDTCSAEELEAGVYYKAWSVFENGDKGSVEELSEFVINEDTDLLDWDNISELIQSGEAQTFGGLELGGLLYTPHKTYGCTTTNDTYHKKEGQLTLRIMGFDFEEVNYKGNPNGSPQHSMTVWSEFNLGTKCFCPAEKAYALTEDTHFHKDYELELIATATGEGVKNNKVVSSDVYIPFFLADETQTGYSRIWRSYYGKHKLVFNQTSRRWEVIQLNTGQVIYSSKDDSLEPFDNRYVENDNVSIANPEELKWEKSNDKFIILNKNKRYYLKDDNTFIIDENIVDGAEIPENTYYEINPDLNGPRASLNSSINSPYQWYRNMYGNNRYYESPVRQYLTSDKIGGTWYHKGNIWSNIPTAYVNEDGFMRGFTDEKFLNHLATVKNYVEKSYASYGGGYDIIYDKVYLASRGNVGLYNDNTGYGIYDEFNCDIDGKFEVGTKHGTYFPYLRNIYVSDSLNDMYNNSVLNPVRMRRNYNDNSVNFSWLRSPGIGFSFNGFFIHKTGQLYNYTLRISGLAGLAPVFTII